ncbi:MAG: sugar phosphate isomerase/epimerase [Kiritimatiellae bacterium]|nr:sugar phosphate isomerase/epimerase [Kiritimatiellia bacterium]
MNRREFIGLAAAGVAAGAAADCCSAAGCAKKGKMLFGVCCGPDQVPQLKEISYDFWEWNGASAFIPTKSDEEWKKHRDEKILSAALPIRSVNGFLPGSFRLTGPNASFAEPLKYAETLCRRADEVGLKTIVFGSGGARNVPGDICGPKDQKPLPEKGVEQYTDFCRQLAARISDLKVCVVIEPLRPNESNIINYVWQGLQIVEDVNSPRIQQLADLFHMIMGREPAESIVKAGCRLKHVHIAEKETRQYPGKDDFDFSPYFDALKKIGYSGGISCECGWPNRKDKDAFYAARVKALAAMKKFAGQA